MQGDHANRSEAPGFSRRTFLQAGTAGAIGWSLPRPTGLVDRRREDHACIQILNVGGPSHLDLFDLKPHAPAEIRGPFQPIRTVAPDIQISELLPRHAQVADRFSLLRACCHDAPAVHDIGWQLLQTGRWFCEGEPHPHAGSVVGYLRGSRNGWPPFVVLPQTLGRGGGNLPHGQAGGFLGQRHDPWTPEGTHSFNRKPEAVRERYGRSRFGQCCLLARQLIEAGVRFVTVNAFHTVYDEITWDIHGGPPFSTLDQMRSVVAPQYDQAYSALIEDLDQRGLLATTLVCNVAEFGRTPRINRAGGRDHWPHCFTCYCAGGGVQGGRVIGRSDARGAEPADRPVRPAEIVATILYSLGLDPALEVPDSAGLLQPLLPPGTRAIQELF